MRRRRIAPAHSRPLVSVEVEDIEHKVRAAVHQDNVAADEEVPVAGRRRRQTSLKIHRAWLHLPAQPRRERSANHELPFEPRR